MTDNFGDIITAQNNDAFIQNSKAYVKKGTLPFHTAGYRNKVEKTGKDTIIPRHVPEEFSQEKYVGEPPIVLDDYSMPSSTLSEFLRTRIYHKAFVRDGRQDSGGQPLAPSV